jgi:hypothetical protein
MGAGLLVFCSGLLLAQEGTSEEEAEETSQHVDESDEGYRARMQLRDQRYREQSRMQTTYTTPSGEAKIDKLPKASQEHIKDEMRNMIIESRVWKPGEDLTDYPYQPSEDAQSDAALAQQEREAFVEELQEFQEREAAAYASQNERQQGEQGEQGGQAGQSGSEGQQGQQGQSGSQSQSSAQGSEGSQSQASSSSSAQSSESSEQQSEPVSEVGVSENALSFLQAGGQAGKSSDSKDSGQPQPPAPEQSDSQAGPGGENDESESEPEPTDSNEELIAGSLTHSELSALQGMNTQADEQGESEKGESEQGQPEQGQPEQAAPTDAVEPGTIDVAELGNLQDGNGRIIRAVKIIEPD